MRCRYHGWTYDLRGQLRGTPEFDGVADFRREDNGLVPLAVDAWGPFVWARIAQGDQSLSEFLAPLARAHGAHSGLEQLQFVERREYDLACNWKVYVDNYLDGGYHVNTIHPGLAGVLDYSQYRTEIAGNTSVQISPLKPPERSAIRQSAKSARGGIAYYWWVFPNFMINVYGGVMDTNLVLPLGPDRCRVIFDFYFRETEGTRSSSNSSPRASPSPTRCSTRTWRSAKTCSAAWRAAHSTPAASASAARWPATIFTSCWHGTCRMPRTCSRIRKNSDRCIASTSRP